MKKGRYHSENGDVFPFLDYNRFYRMPKDCSNKKNSKIGVTYFTITMYSLLPAELGTALGNFVDNSIRSQYPSDHNAG